jgi:hypothetical protein
MVAGWPNPTPMQSRSPSHGVQRMCCSRATAAAWLPATACGLLALAVACCVGVAGVPIIDAGDCKWHTLSCDSEQCQLILAAWWPPVMPFSLALVPKRRVSARRWATIGPRRNSVFPYAWRVLASQCGAVRLHASQRMHVGSVEVQFGGWCCCAGAAEAARVRPICTADACT